jgi:hypothetical protein
MSVFDKSSTRRDLILNTMTDLWGRQSEIDLGDIDGMYFWHVCHQDRIKGFKELIGRAGAEEIDEYIEEMSREIPYIVDWLRNGGVPTMRAPMFKYAFANQVDSSVPFFGTTSSFGTFPSVERFWARLMVFDRSSTGRDVERELRRKVAEEEEHDPQVFTRALSGDLESVRLSDATSAPHLSSTSFSSTSIRFCRPGELQIQQWWFVDPSRRREWVPVKLPNIWVTVMMPLPPEGIVAATYDAIARQHNQWHLHLVGDERKQSNRAAIRAWAAGLLINDGMPVSFALSAVEQRMGSKPYTVTRFNQDRLALVSRVPEAEWFVFSSRDSDR